MISLLVLAELIAGVGVFLLIIGLLGVIISAVRGRRKMPGGIVCLLGLILIAAGSYLSMETVLKNVVEVDLREAVAKELIEVEASGDGLDEVEITLTSNSDEPLRVTINPGTIFEAQFPRVQSMVIIKERAVTLQHRDDSISLEILAACLDMLLDVPGKDDAFIVSNISATGDLMKLLSLPNFYNETLRVRQFAIWTITENPARNEYMGIGTFWGTGPSDDEMRKILDLFERAGIDASKYRALQEID